MNNKFKVNYLSKDFSSIKEELKKYAKRYYSDKLSDLSDASLTSFLIESVAYVGDVLTYYLDYQTNESFLATAMQRDNILNIAKSLGYKQKINYTGSGKLALYILIPDLNGAPDYSKVPIIKKGTSFRSENGATFVSSEDVIIDANLIGASYVVARVNNVGKPTFYAAKTYVPILSGKIVIEKIPVGEYQKFKKIYLQNSDAVEIVSIVDSEGNYYYEVPNLSQNIIYTSVYNAVDLEQKHMLRPLLVPRRFIFDFDETFPYIMFGAKKYKPDDDLGVNPTYEPIKFSLNKYNNDYLSDGFFEPSALVNGDSFGIVPEDTTLTITYRVNSFANVNAPINSITFLDELKSSFTAQDLTDPVKSAIVDSIQVTNEEAIIGDAVSLFPEEIRDLGGKIFSAQSRAVTASDYETLCYSMPTKYGTIKRVKVERDSSSLKNNINIYTICEDVNGKLIKSNSAIKENLKTWLSHYKVITDTVDILDAKVINFGVHFSILVDPNVDRLQILEAVKSDLRTYLLKPPQIGEAFNILELYRKIRNFKEVLDIKDLIVVSKTGASYSNIKFNIEQNLTLDGMIIKIPKNVIYEIKYPNSDITGDVV